MSKNLSIVIYTDGSTNTFEDIDKQLSGYSVYVPEVKDVCDELKIIRSAVGLGINTTEAMAIQLALETCNIYFETSVKSVLHIEIISDSKNCVNSLNTYYKNWMRNADKQGNWIKSNGEIVDNQSLFRKILSMKALFKSVTFTHINSHIGNPGNDMADELAKQAVNELYVKIKNQLS